MRRGRLRWHGLEEIKDDSDYVKACTRMVVEGKASVGRPRKTWQNTDSADLHLAESLHPPMHPRPKELEGHRTA